jgi:2-dehydropantoate 2-reductase
MNTVIVGQGAIGLLCYHRLYQLSENKNNTGTISLWPSKPTKQSYYTFCEMNENPQEFPITIANKNDLRCARVIVVCVKSYQVSEALKDIHHLIADDAIIILSHNGLGTREEVHQLLKPSQRLLALLLTQGAKKVADYHVQHTGMGASDLGIIYGNLSSIEQGKIFDYFQQGLKQLNWQDNIEQAQWRKLAINCVINPLTSIENIENGKVNQQKYQETIRSVIQEVVKIAAKEGVSLTELSLLNLVSKVAQSTSGNTSSMRADRLAKRYTEIEYINGYIHRLGKKHQLATPKNTQLWLAVKALKH